MFNLLSPPMTPTELSKLCDELLSTNEFKDYCPNGLQVDADAPISRIVTGVTACQALIDKAAELKAEAILVHHGFFWKNEPETLTGFKGKRIRTLLKNNISLLAYHLPLDAHPTLGNNVGLAQALELNITGPLFPNEKHSIGNIAICETMSADDFAKKITQNLGRTPTYIKANPNRPLHKIALCTGGAQDMITQAALMGCDAFISGEISERTTHLARELGVDYFAVGHHDSEIFGIQALGEYLAHNYGFQVRFINVPNPA